MKSITSSMIGLTCITEKSKTSIVSKLQSLITNYSKTLLLQDIHLRSGREIFHLYVYIVKNDTPEHMILVVKIRWKHIVLGLAGDVPNSRNITRNNLISIIAYSIDCT